MARKKKLPPGKETSKNHIFEVILEYLDVKSDSRCLFLDHFPPAQTQQLFERLNKQWDQKVAWHTLEECADKALFHQAASESSWLIMIDAQHVHDRNEVITNVKRFLSAFPKYRILVLGIGNLDKIKLASIYGKSLYISYLEQSVGPKSLVEDIDSQNDEALLCHSKKLSPKYSLNQLVLGPKASIKILEALNYIKTKSFVDNEWGFGALHSRGHGVTLLFHGESGTGKTMAAEVIANEVGLPIYQIDLSSVVSKWMGETEKNLKLIFQEARSIQGILLFDEGDSLFGARTNVKASQDRYSNLEINYLLQEIEAYDGIVILSTNYEKNMDPAFLRRFTYSISLGRPNQTQREQIWKVNTPQQMPLAKDVNYSHLSKISLTGGNIKNCIRDAAAIAATRKAEAVSHSDFLMAIRRELQKQGGDLSRQQLGETYWRAVGREWDLTRYRKMRKTALEKVRE